MKTEIADIKACLKELEVWSCDIDVRILDLEETQDSAEDEVSSMHLHDYFATKAMQSYLRSSGAASQDDVANISYRMADAMLKARLA